MEWSRVSTMQSVTAPGHPATLAEGRPSLFAVAEVTNFSSRSILLTSWVHKQISQFPFVCMVVGIAVIFGIWNLSWNLKDQPWLVLYVAAHSKNTLVSSLVLIIIIKYLHQLRLRKKYSPSKAPPVSSKLHFLCPFFSLHSFLQQICLYSCKCQAQKRCRPRGQCRTGPCSVGNLHHYQAADYHDVTAFRLLLTTWLDSYAPEFQILSRLAAWSSGVVNMTSV